MMFLVCDVIYVETSGRIADIYIDSLYINLMICC